MRLEKGNEVELLSLLKTWASTLDIEYENVRERVGACYTFLSRPDTRTSDMLHGGVLHLHVSDGNFTSSSSHNTNVYKNPAQASPIENQLGMTENTPKVIMTISGNFPHDKAVVKVNAQFEHLFGISQATIDSYTNIMGSGLLPWGGDLLCLFVPNEADILAFMQICAINFTWKVFYDWKSGGPVLREVPSAHVLQISSPNSAHPIPCLMKSVHRELFGRDEGISMNIVFGFEPCTPMGIMAPPVSDASSHEPDESSLVDDEETMFLPDVDYNVPDSEFVQDLLSFATLDDL